MSSTPESGPPARHDEHDRGRRDLLRDVLQLGGMAVGFGLGAAAFGSPRADDGAVPPTPPERPIPPISPDVTPLPAQPLYRLSLAQWSLHRTLFAGQLDNRDFAKAAKRTHGFDAIEYVNQFFRDKATDAEYIADLRKRADEEDVRTLLIMCDGLGRLGDPDDAGRRRAVEAHVPWLEASKALGGHSIRVNAASAGERDEQSRLVADGLHQLAEHAEPLEMTVIVENHGGYSSDAEWLMATIARAEHPRLGTLPDFGNFRISSEREFDRYEGVRLMMPLATAVSAKSHDFDDDGNERFTDYRRMMRIVVDAGYRGYVGVEYEGSRLSETEGIAATKRLLERVRAEIGAATKVE